MCAKFMAVSRERLGSASSAFSLRAPYPLHLHKSTRNRVEGRFGPSGLQRHPPRTAVCVPDLNFPEADNASRPLAIHFPEPRFSTVASRLTCV
jgi:hypothetical protein